MLFHCKYSRQVMLGKVYAKKYWPRRNCGTRECAVERCLPCLRQRRRRQSACPLLWDNGVIANLRCLYCFGTIQRRCIVPKQYVFSAVSCGLYYMTSIPRFWRGLHRVGIGLHGLLKTSAYLLAAADVGKLPLTTWRQQVGLYRTSSDTSPSLTPGRYWLSNQWKIT